MHTQIEPKKTIATIHATGQQPGMPNRSLSFVVTPEDFERVKAEAISQGTSMGAILRQLVDLL
jgi:hypothetical protein